jgi:hypothetical protein
MSHYTTDLAPALEAYLHALKAAGSALSAASLAAHDAFDTLHAAADTEARAAAPFEQAFAELALVCSPSFGAEPDTLDEVARLDAVTFALDKLPQLDPHRVTDLLQKTAALAALAAAAAADLEAAAELHEVAFRPELDLSLAVTARAELRAALECLDGLAALSATRERP